MGEGGAVRAGGSHHFNFEWEVPQGTAKNHGGATGMGGR